MRILRRLAALVLGLFVALVLLEAGLWIASAFVRGGLREPQGASGRSILCIGDSNTYGVRLEADESYPGQLQALLDAAGEHLTVVNRGYPGQNSAQVRSSLEQSFAELEPAAVVAWAGVNDRWSLAEKHEWGEAANEHGLGDLLAKSRTLRLARILATSGGAQEATSVARLDGAGLTGAREDELHARGSEETRASIRANLERIASLCAERGARLVLVTYPLFLPDLRADVNGTIRAVASERGLELADLEPRFEELVGKLGGEHIYLPSDTHLSAVGNHEAARQVALALARAGVVSTAVAPPPLEERFGGIELELRVDGGRAAVELSGPASWGWRLQLNGRYEMPAVRGGVFYHQAELDELGITGEESKRWRGRFDAAGRASTEIAVPPPHESARFLGWELSAVAIDALGGSRAVRFSNAVPLPAGAESEQR